MAKEVRGNADEREGKEEKGRERKRKEEKGREREVVDAEKRW